MVRAEVEENFFLPGRPENLHFADLRVGSQAKVNSQVILGEIAAAAEHFAFLHQVSSKTFDSRVEGQTIALVSFQFEADPVIRWATFGPKYGGLALKILNYHFEFAVVEEITDGYAAAYLGNFQCRTGKLADVLEGVIALIEVQELGFHVLRAADDGVDLRIDVTIDLQKVQPAIIIEIEKRIAPADVLYGALGDV